MKRHYKGEITIIGEKDILTAFIAKGYTTKPQMINGVPIEKPHYTFTPSNNEPIIIYEHQLQIKPFTYDDRFDKEYYMVTHDAEMFLPHAHYDVMENDLQKPLQELLQNLNLTRIDLELDCRYNDYSAIVVGSILKNSADIDVLFDEGE